MQDKKEQEAERAQAQADAQVPFHWRARFFALEFASIGLQEWHGFTKRVFA